MAQAMKHHTKKATPKQMAYLEGLAKRKGYRYPGAAIKAAIGKNPVGGLNRERASRVIDFLKG